MISKCVTAVVAMLLIPIHGVGEQIYEQLPSDIVRDEKYVFYSHGLIVEGEDETPLHPKFGVYQFPTIKERLFELGSFNLIAHHRPKNTDMYKYANTLSSWVVALLEAGVPGSNITLIGFSRGSHITALVSARFQAQQINTVLIAGCIDGDMLFDPPVYLGGRLLSIYETSDVPGSCSLLASRSQLTSFTEIAVSTGKGHGAFFTPSDDWVAPIQRWIQ